jgi:hypothetical protein
MDTDINKKRRRFRPGLNAGVPTPKTDMGVRALFCPFHPKEMA